MLVVEKISVTKYKTQEVNLTKEYTRVVYKQR